MKEVVVVSGKGGTGKTSIVASFAFLAERKVMADCDVDAADLHLILHPKIRYCEAFFCGKVARIETEKCTGCGKCRDLCRFDAISEKYIVDTIDCEGCGVCYYACPENAVVLEEKKSGEWFISDTDYGPMVHAKLGIAEENSGKLVSLVRLQARRLAEEQNLDLVIIDGAPGIGCPVIASITGADLVLAVTEPTMSGLHDLKRVVELAEHFRIKTMICVNKYDINHEIKQDIVDFCEQKKILFAGQIPYDNVVTKAQIAGVSVVEYSRAQVSMEIERIWKQIFYTLSVEATVRS
ncbi:MAG: ATP-binding protein [bacterium]